MANSLTIEKIDAAYGAVRVLENVSLNVNTGETVVLLGTNGNGKSTLMKCVMFAPKATPAEVVTYLRTTVNKAAHSEQFKAALANLGQELAYMDQPEFAAFWETDSKRMEAAIRSIGKVEG